MANIVITDCPRDLTKQEYRLVWRSYRIAAKKALKVATRAMGDLMVYGAAITKMDGNKLLNIPLEVYKQVK